MVKELTMENTILALGSSNDVKVAEADLMSNTNEFQKVFETTTQYADKNSLKSDAQKVVNAAEKTVSKEGFANTKRTNSNKDAVSNITKVSKKVSISKLSPKSPKTANATTPVKQTVQNNEVNTASDAYSFSVKEALNSEATTVKTNTQTVVNEKVNAEVVTTPTMEESVTIDTTSNQETVTGVDVQAEADVVIEENVETDITVEEDVDVVVDDANVSNVTNVIASQAMATEIVTKVAEKPATGVTISEENDEEDEETSSVSLLDALTTEDETVVEDTETKSTVEIDSEVDNYEGITGGASEVEEVLNETELVEMDDKEVEVSANSNKLELKEGWETVSDEERQALEQEISNLDVTSEDNTTATDTTVVQDTTVNAEENVSVKLEENSQNNQNIEKQPVKTEKVDTEKTVALKTDVQVDKDMSKLDLKDVDIHTQEEIDAAKKEMAEQAQKEIVVESTNEEIELEVDTKVDNKIQDVKETIDVEQVEQSAQTEKTEQTILDEIDTEISTNKVVKETVAVEDNIVENEIKIQEETNNDTQVKDTTVVEEDIVKTKTKDLEVVEDTNSTQKTEKTEASTTENTTELNAEIEEEVVVKDVVSTNEDEVKAETENETASNKDVALKSEKEVVANEKTEKTAEVSVDTDVDNVKTVVANKEVKAEKEVVTSEKTPITEEIAVAEDEVLEEDVENTSVDKIVTKEEHETSTNELVSEDLDLYIDNCIKLAYVEAPVKQTSDEQDIISALESKFDDIEIDTDMEYSASTDENLMYDDAENDVEYEQIASLDELVSVDEVDDLKLQLNDQTLFASEEITVNSTTNLTTEQMIRYSIEGEIGLEPTIQLANTFKPEVSVQQSAPSSAKNVLAQLSEKLSTFNLSNGSKLTMQLSPENLGKIEIRLANTSNGIIAEMTVSSDETCEMMKKNIDELKETLQKYGVRFDSVNVRTASAQQSAANQQDYTEQQGNAQKQQHEQKREEKENRGERSFDEAFSSLTEDEIKE